MAEVAVAYDWTLGDRLQKTRRSAGLDQAAMALLVGTSRPNVSKWERNLGEPRVSQLMRWAEVTNVPAQWLLGISELGSASPCFWPLPHIDGQMELALDLERPFLMAV